jgi:hypothetical protein
MLSLLTAAVMLFMVLLSGAAQGDSPIIVPLALLQDPDNPQYQITGLEDNKICRISETFFYGKFD